jgi:hypothetical protein
MKQPTKGQQLALAGLAVVVGLGLAEGLARVWSGGAFPHANFYVADDDLGVRLEPGATMRFQLGENPAHDIRVNAQGYRGADWPAPGADELLVVGDSQVFGLGVEGDETFSARLAEATGRTVLNGGVPTYGPDEYAAVVAEVLEARPVTTVVLTLNMSNDLFELSKPNRERHAVWDGWAVRIETAPESVMDFPGRTWLMRHSHLVYTARRLMAEQGPTLDPSGAPSEGVWQDLVATADDAATAAEEAATDAAQRKAQRETKLSDLRSAAENAAYDADQLLIEEVGGSWSKLGLAWSAARGNPGDIVNERYAESSRSIAATARLIRKAGQHREETAAKAKSRKVKAALERAEEAEAAWQAARRALPPAPPESIVAPYLERVQDVARAHDAELVVIVLPLDVQVDPAEWAKYGAEPVDMAPSLALNADIADAARRRGLRVLDARPSLAAAEPGAFLDGDLHMTAKGHAALAEALATTLAEPAPLAQPRHGLPEGRTVVPDRDVWARTQEVTVKGSSRARCETVIVDEWLRVDCIRKDGRRPTGVEPLSGAVPDTHTSVTRDAATLVTPLAPGRPLRARFSWAGYHQVLEVDWEGETPKMRLTDRATPGEPAPRFRALDHLCKCQQEVRRERVCETRVDGEPVSERELERILLADDEDRLGSYVDHDGCEGTCAYIQGEPSQACEDAFFDDCAGLLRCVRGDEDVAPGCGEGAARMAGSRQCRPLCDDAHPCDEGVCQPWMGAGVCVVGGG